MRNTPKLENIIQEQINLRLKYNNARNRSNLSIIVNKCLNNLNQHMNSWILSNQTFNLISECGLQL